MGSFATGGEHVMRRDQHESQSTCSVHSLSLIYSLNHNMKFWRYDEYYIYTTHSKNYYFSTHNITTYQHLTTNYHMLSQYPMIQHCLYGGAIIVQTVTYDIPLTIGTHTPMCTHHSTIVAVGRSIDRSIHQFTYPPHNPFYPHIH